MEGLSFLWNAFELFFIEDEQLMEVKNELPDFDWDEKLLILYELVKKLLPLFELL